VGIPKEIADDKFYENMKMIVTACTRWEWLKLLRMQQVELYYFMVKHVGDHAYAADKSHMEINFI